MDRPLVLAAWNDGVAVRFGTFPARAKTRGVQFPSAGALLTTLSAWLTGHFPVRVKVILNWVPLIVEAVNGLPLKNVA